MTWIVVQHRGYQAAYKIDGSYIVRDVELIKRVRRQMGEPVVAVIRLKVKQ